MMRYLFCAPLMLFRQEMDKGHEALAQLNKTLPKSKIAYDVCKILLRSCGRYLHLFVLAHLSVCRVVALPYALRKIDNTDPLDEGKDVFLSVIIAGLNLT